MYVSPWKMMSTSGAGEILGGMFVGMLPGAPAGGGVITGVPDGASGEFDSGSPVGVGPVGTPTNVNISPSVVIVDGDIGIGTVSEPITIPDGPITIAEPSASVIVMVEAIGIVVPSSTIAGSALELL